MCVCKCAQRFVVGSRTQIRKKTFFGPQAFDAGPHCHYGTQTRTIIAPLLTPPLLGLKMKCQNPKAEGDHNKLIINRKWLHYGLKDRRECSLVTALTQIHTFLQGLGRARSPLWTLLPSHCLRPGALLRVQLGHWRDLGVLEEGLEGCRCLGWPNNQKTLDSPCLVTLHTCSEWLWGESSGMQKET